MAHGYKLTERIIALSVSNTWDQAKQEWDVEYIFFADEFEECLCGHYPIRELCHLRNRENQQEAVVGNVCVKKFLGINLDSVIRAIRKVIKDDSKALNADAIEYAWDHDWIDEWQYEFYSKTWRLRKLTEKQLAKRVEVNKQVIRHVVRARTSRSS